MVKKLFNIMLSLLLLMSALTSCSQKTEEPPDTVTTEYSEPVREVRGIYIATVYNIDFPSKRGMSEDELKEELDRIIELTGQIGCNAVYFQVRGAADAMYDSKIFPVSEYLTGEKDGELPDGFDPLSYLIEHAHSKNIDVHAWVNPLRVTRGGSVKKPKTVDDLPLTSPARTSPELTVSYAGEIYFDAGNPDARELIADGVREVVENYDVDGVLFDDYFYPYPVDGCTFDDALTYEKYGGGKELGDWRRENINKMVKSCFDAVKSADPDCAFGIAPCGIWQNDDGENGGSATRGFEAYESIYCDTLAWVRGGYVDYVAPQIYWNFGHKSAPYAVLADWWCAQLDGTGVDFLISHAAYKYGTDEWGFAGAVDEMKEQIGYARELISYGGSIFYGFSEIRDDVDGLAGEISECYTEETTYQRPLPSDGEIYIVDPESGTKIDSSTVTIHGKSAAGAPVTCDGAPVCRRRGGDFYLTVQLKQGKNSFVFRSGECELEYVLTYSPE